jgi:hypothetical protein
LIEKREPILHHTVSRKGGPKDRHGEKGIIWPAKHLTKDIGPRPPGSPGERSAARFIEKEFKTLGFEVGTQRFKTPVTTAWSEFAVHLIMVAGVLYFPFASHISIVLIVLGFILFLLEEYGRSPFTWLQPHRQSANVVTSLDPIRENRRTLVLLAHTDSPRSAFFYHPGLVRLFRSFLLLDILCQAGLFMLFTFLYGGYLLKIDDDTLMLLWRIGLLLLIIPVLAIIALLGKAVWGKATPGGNDNASGIAVLLELARVYSRRHPLNIELWLVCTGASDASGMGIRRLLRENRRQLKGAYFIVLDQLGGGNPICYRREGRLITFRANRHLISLAKNVSNNQTHYSAGFRRNNLYISEGFQLISRGKKSITISTRDKSRYPNNWKWSGDDYDNLDPRSLRLSFDFIRALVDTLDRSDLKK